jgi:hypothetical protein
LFYDEADIDTMLADSPHSITIAAVTRKCEFRETDALEGDVIVRVGIALVKTADYPNVAGGAACQVNGENFTVWTSMRSQDGGMTTLTLKRA